MKQKKLQKGFSILEVVVTLFIIGIIFVLYQSALNSVLLTRNAKNQEIALRIANNKIEELRATGYSSLPSSGTFTDTQLNNLSSGSASMTFSDFNATTKQVTITVQWREPGAVSLRSVSLTSLITKTGGL